MIAKVTLFSTLLAIAHAAALLAPTIFNTGASVSSRKQDGAGNYAFTYDIADGKGATNGRTEVGDGLGNKKGSYTITDVDGRARVVEYVADALGFRAAVKTNEPGTAASLPAAAAIVSPYAAPVAPAPIAVAAPVAVASPIQLAGPVVIGAPSSYSTSISHGSPIGIGGPIFGVNTLGLGLSKGLWL